MLPSPRSRGLGLRTHIFSRPPLGSLTLRPGDSLTIPKMASSVGFIRFVSSPDATQATKVLTLPPVGLTPTEHASLTWTHCLANIAPGQKSLMLASPVGTLRGDASRHPDGCCGPIGSGNASRPPARDFCPAPPTRRPRAFE